MAIDALHQGARAARILQIVHLALEGVQLLPHGLELVPGVGLGGLQLSELHVVLLHLLFQIQGAAAAGAALHAGAQQQTGAAQEQEMGRTGSVHDSLVSALNFSTGLGAARKYVDDAAQYR